MMIQEFDYSVNLLLSILWQYNEATNLQSIITQKQNWYDTNQSEFWSSWYTDVFNLYTANSFGLVVWSLILNVPLYIDFNPEPDSAPIWGFNRIVGSWPTLYNTYLNFGNSNFSTQGQVLTLTEEEQRFLLRLRYFQLYTFGNIQDVQTPGAAISGINNFLNYLISTSSIGYTGTVYVLDGLDMTMTYVFTGSNFPPNLLTILQDPNLDILPRPAGVELKFIVDSGTQWGFGMHNENFGNGNFIQIYS